MKYKDNSVLTINLKPLQYGKVCACADKFGVSPSTLCRFILIHYFALLDKEE